MTELFICLGIFLAKVIEISLGTLRTITVVNGRKWLSAILYAIIGLIWVIAVGAVVSNVQDYPLRLLSFVAGYFFGSYLGSWLEEKIALGNNMLTAIVDKENGQNVADTLRDNGFAVTTMDAYGKDADRLILMIIVSRRQISKVSKIIRSVDKQAMIVSGSANPIYGGYNQK